MSSKRFVTTVVGFGALAASVMVLPGVLDAASNEVRPVPMGVSVDGTKECEEEGFTGTTGVKVESSPFADGEVIVVPVDGGTVTFTFSNPNDDGEAQDVTVTFSGVTGVAIVGKAGQAVLVDDTPPFSLTFTQGISNVSACFTTGSTTTTTGGSTTTTAGSTTTTTGDSTTTTTGGSSTTTGGSSTVVPPPSTMPNTGAGDSSNLIGAALLALMAGGLALLFSRRRAA
ncbi:MAG: LPXTG cell wall anchor domain-containing protein [Ilumatobacteraceae bacterium]